ncbi:MAG: Tetratricopeptide domain protein [Sphingobacteriaceae bacterium]|jgi:tetratricopeptide (TPR) repeat protein|nr:Tetratricopeptide domain protein [Sphingobacteriaceae bacterium]
MKVIENAIKAAFILAIGSSATYAQSTGDAIRALDAEQYQKAKGMLKGLIQAKPDEPDNYFWLGQTYLETDYPDSAKTVFLKGSQVDPKSPWNYIGLGAVDLEKNNPAAAKANFDLAIDKGSRKDAKPYVYVGRAYTRATKPDYKAALEYLNKGKAVNDKDAALFLQLADTHRDMMDASSAYGEYRTASDLDKDLLRAKVELGVLNLRSGAFQESVDVLKGVIAANPNYGPAYRALGETYYRWANADLKNFDPKIKEAVAYYEKYLDLTDRSLDSRLRYADFLYNAKDFKTLANEARAMSQMDKSNARVFRYLGYAAYENGNYAGSQQALKDFIAKVEPARLIPQDFMYLGQAQLKSGDTTTALVNLKKAIDADSTLAGVMGDIAKGFFSAGQYDRAAEAYELSLRDPKASLLDYYYLGASYYYDYGKKLKADPKTNFDNLVKADSAFSKLLAKSPTTEIGYMFRARIQRAQDDADDSKGLAVPMYEKAVEVINSDPEKTQKDQNKRFLLEAYTYLGSVAARRDKDNAKALDYFNKGLALDPANATLQQAKKAVSPGK